MWLTNHVEVNYAVSEKKVGCDDINKGDKGDRGDTADRADRM